MNSLSTFTVGQCRRPVAIARPRRVVVRANLTLKVEEIEVLNSRGVAVHDFGTNFLYEGCYGEDVNQLQRYLQEEGYFRSEDGCTSYFGKVTKEAVERWQKDHNVEATGNFGPLSRKAYELELRQRMFSSRPTRSSPAPSQSVQTFPETSASSSKFDYGWIPSTAAAVLLAFLAYKAASAIRKTVRNRRINEQLIKEDRNQQLSRWRGTVQQDGNNR